jgi:hypothetical protein
MFSGRGGMHIFAFRYDNGPSEQRRQAVARETQTVPSLLHSQVPDNLWNETLMDFS